VSAVEVVPAGNVPGAIAKLADAFAAEWPAWIGKVGRRAVEEIFEEGEQGALPAVLVAHRAGEILGTVALRAFFAEAPMAESPWVRQLYVFPAHRGRGVDRALMRAVEAEARRRGFPRIYAATTRIETLGARWGWEPIRRLDHRGEPMVWMVKRLD
jgi:GNAT superfamily N-acetyltransferase